MPLNERVTFQGMIQKGNKVQIPKLMRWQFKMETGQVLRVSVAALALAVRSQVFYAKMAKDGRISIPKLTVTILKREKPNLLGYVLEIILEPA